MLVSGWLDDIGLPQYKSHFDEARVDGRMLHFMTVVSCRDCVDLSRCAAARVVTSQNDKNSLHCFPGGLAVTEGGQRSSPPQH